MIYSSESNSHGNKEGSLPTNPIKHSITALKTLQTPMVIHTALNNDKAPGNMIKNSVENSQKEKLLKRSSNGSLHNDDVSPVKARQSKYYKFQSS